MSKVNTNDSFIFTCPNNNGILTYTNIISSLSYLRTYRKLLKGIKKSNLTNCNIGTEKVPGFKKLLTSNINAVSKDLLKLVAGKDMIDVVDDEIYLSSAKTGDVELGRRILLGNVRLADSLAKKDFASTIEFWCEK